MQAKAAPSPQPMAILLLLVTSWVMPEMNGVTQGYGRAAFLRVEVRGGHVRVDVRGLTGFNSA